MSDDKRGKFLQQLRVEKNLTQKELSEILHYSDNAVSSWETGKTLPNNPETLMKLSELYNVSLEELLYGERKNSKNSKEISDNMENVYQKNYKSFKRALNLVFILILIILVISMFSIYFIFIKGKILSYTIQGNSDRFIIDKSTILFTEKIDILNFNRVISKNGEDINNIALYYMNKSNEKSLIFSGPNDNYYIEEPSGYNEYNLDELMNNTIYVDIIFDDNSKETIPLTLSKRFVNDDIFIANNVNIADNNDREINLDKDKIKTTLLKENFTETNDGYEKISNQKKFIYNLNTKEIYLFNQSKDINEQITIDIERNTLSYMFYDKKQDDYIEETYSLAEDLYKNKKIKFINENIDYLLYLKNAF